MLLAGNELFQITYNTKTNNILLIQITLLQIFIQVGTNVP